MCGGRFGVSSILLARVVVVCFFELVVGSETVETGIVEVSVTLEGGFCTASSDFSLTSGIGKYSSTSTKLSPCSSTSSSRYGMRASRISGVVSSRPASSYIIRYATNIYYELQKKSNETMKVIA
ncbi:hypothetical protein Hanom_Chr06g00560271 [Helianthus anomalus]